MTVAVRTDPLTLVTEEVRYFGDSPRMFGVAHLPTDPKAAVLVCSPTHADLLKSYHLEVVLARELARSGIAARRFQYPGSGNSEGDIEDLSLRTMRKSAVVALETLMDQVGDVPIGFVGVRLGVFPAIAAARHLGRGPIAMWAPVVDTDAFTREALLSHSIAAIKGEGKPESSADLMEQLLTRGQVELTGYRYTKHFHDSISGLRLVEDPPEGHSVAVVPFEPLPSEQLVGPWQEKGIDVVQLEATGRKAWWLGDRAGDDSRGERGHFIDETVSWFVQHLL